MKGTEQFAASRVRAQLNHPVIDADGHWLEFGPFVREEMRKVGGNKAVDGFSYYPRLYEKGLAMSLADRRANRAAQRGFWLTPTKNTRDRATAIMPQLMYERMDEMGFDFSVIYPTAGLALPLIPDAEQRQMACRAFNTVSTNYFGKYSDRLTPSAVIPMHTPDEAIEELEYAVKQLGMKVVMLGSLMRRDIPAVAEAYPEAANFATYREVLGLDSDYDYDPVWAKCVELKVAPTFHTPLHGFATRVSPSNFTYNHIGHFAAAGEAVCKALFLGGVTKRFPQLKFGFLEGGVAWACQLYVDLIEHWEKRNIDALAEVNPANLDHELFRELAEQYGNASMVESLKDRQAAFDVVMTPDSATTIRDVDNLDDYSACAITNAEDFKELFTKNFYFGCEADDRMNALAFHRRIHPFGARFNALLGSDIGHFDVSDMASVLSGAHEFVENELMTPENFRDFVCDNAIRFWGETNPDFFKGTVVEKEAAAVLS